MAAPRKVFRIEQTAAARIPPHPDRNGASSHRGETTQALAMLQAPMASEPDLTAEDRQGQADNLTRITQELDAVISGTAQATQRILAAAEEIDQLAGNLSAVLKERMEQELAQDISDGVLRIFEACNFQDLIGQRVAKVMKTLRTDAPSISANGDAPALHGPRLNGDAGHMSQAEIDALFGA